MRFYTGTLLVAAAGVAVAQYPVTTSSTWNPSATDASSGCVGALTSLVNECLKTEQPKVDACAANDWSCYCSAQQQVMTCFNNCPSDSRAFGAQQQETQWCAAAKSYGSTSSTIHYPQKTPAPKVVGSGSGSGSSHHSSKSGSGNSPSSDDSSDNGAFAMAAPVSGAFAALLGAMAFL